MKLKFKKNNRKKLNNIKIGWKYALVFAITMALFIISAGIVFYQTQNIKNAIEVQTIKGDKSVMMTEMGSLIRTKDVRVANYVVMARQETYDEFIEKSDQFDQLLNILKQDITDERQLNILNQVIENNKEYNDLFLNVIAPAVDRQNKPVYITARAQSDKLRSETVQLLDNLRKMVQEERNMAIQASNMELDRANMVLATSIILSLLIGSILLMFLNRMIQRNLNEVVSMASEISKGNLQVDSIKYEGNDEIGQLAKANNQMRDNLKQIIEKIAAATVDVSSKSEELTQSSNEVKQGSEQIASTMQELSSGAESQANSSSSLSEMMDSFTKKIQYAYKNGEDVAKTSNEILNITDEGSELMKKSVQQMKTIDAIVKESVTKVQGLDDQTKEISKLVKVIQDIAEQTNLLSLNAAIEAARAGEHGKGFAVVANEVRKLAEQVSDSVVDITNIVGNIQKESSLVAESLQSGYEEVDQGTQQIEVTGQTFETINQSVTDMTKRIESISNNLKEIVKSSEEMNTSIQDIASVSEESAAGVEQAAASAQQSSSSMEEISSNADELAKLAEDLNDQIKMFKL